MMEVKTPGWWRAIEVLAGLLVFALAVIVLADPQFVVTTLVYVIGAALLIGGLSRIGVGLFARIFGPAARGLNLGGGIIAVVIGIVVILDPSLGASALILILAAAILLVGVVEIVVGVLAKHRPIWLRTLVVIVGVLTVMLSALTALDTPLGQGLLAAILAIALVFLGVRDIVHGIGGHRPVPVPVGAAVTSV